MGIAIILGRPARLAPRAAVLADQGEAVVGGQGRSYQAPAAHRVGDLDAGRADLLRKRLAASLRAKP